MNDAPVTDPYPTKLEWLEMVRPDMYWAYRRLARYFESWWEWEDGYRLRFPENGAIEWEVIY